MQPTGTELAGTCLLTSGAASAYSGPDGSTRIDWMITAQL